MSTELINVAEIFGENVFNDTVMQERLPKKALRPCIACDRPCRCRSRSRGFYYIQKAGAQAPAQKA